MSTDKIFTEISTMALDKTAIVEGNTVLTYRDFFRLINELSDFLIAQVQNKNYRIGLPRMSPSGLLLSYYACQKAGLTPVLVPFEDAERTDGAIAEGKIGTFLSDPIQKFQIQAVEKHKLAKPQLTIDEREAMVIFTSGTTSSKLKGVRLSHSGISNCCSYMNDLMDFSIDSVELIFAPLDHAYGFGRCHCTLIAGGTVILPHNLRSIGKIFELVDKHNCTALSAPPSVICSLLKAPNEKTSQLAKKIRHIQTGAMRFDTTFRDKLLRLLPETRVFLHYGLSEAMRVTLFELNSHPDKIHTEGLPSRNMDVCIFDGNRPLEKPNHEGLIAVKGANLCLGYLDETLWQEQLLNDYFVTSDRGVLDEDGYLIFKGRSDDVINANGILVHPDEIEKKILEVWPDLVISVVGLRDPSGVKDSIIVLCLQHGSSMDQEKLVFGLKNVDKNLIPQRIVEFETLPKTRTGKTNRKALAEAVTRHFSD